VISPLDPSENETANGASPLDGSAVRNAIGAGTIAITPSTGAVDAAS
jgi:hypothetical protein